MPAAEPRPARCPANHPASSNPPSIRAAHGPASVRRGLWNEGPLHAPSNTCRFRVIDDVAGAGPLAHCCQGTLQDGPLPAMPLLRSGAAALWLLGGLSSLQRLHEPDCRLPARLDIVAWRLLPRRLGNARVAGGAANRGNVDRLSLGRRRHADHADLAPVPSRLSRRQRGRDHDLPTDSALAQRHQPVWRVLQPRSVVAAVAMSRARHGSPGS